MVRPRKIAKIIREEDGTVKVKLTPRAYLLSSLQLKNNFREKGLYNPEERSWLFDGEQFEQIEKLLEAEQFVLVRVK